jgi:hypothetical protein
LNGKQPNLHSQTRSNHTHILKSPACRHLNNFPPTAAARCHLSSFASQTKMSNTLKSKKKPELQALAAELGIDTDGSKSDLEARILLYLSEHVELKSNSKFAKYFASITGPESPGPVASVAAGSHRRRSIAAKKSTELGDVISKALTRYRSPRHLQPPLGEFVYIRVGLT